MSALFDTDLTEVFDFEGSGNATKSAAHNLTEVNTPGYTTALAPGGSQSTQLVAANSEYFTSADNADFDFDGGDYSISFWINFSTAYGAKIAAKGGLFDNDGWQLQIDSSPGGDLFNVRHESQANTANSYADFALIEGTTYHVAYAFDSTAGTITWWISEASFGDKVNGTSTTMSFPAGANTAALFVGALDATNTLDGILDEFSVFKGYILNSVDAQSIFDGTWRATAGAALVGDALSSALAMGDITTAIPLAGAALVVSNAAATLSTQIDMQGAAIASADATGDLTVQISMSGSALAQALASAGLDTAIQMAGAASGQASASGELSGAAALSGIAQAVASGTADLTIQIRLDGAAISSALASGTLAGSAAALAGAAMAQATAQSTLTTQIPVIGHALAAAAAAGDLSTAIPVDGIAQAIADAQGVLTTQIPLAGSAASVTTAIGDLDLSLHLDGAAIAQALASGDLTTKIILNGAALASALASGSLAAQMTGMCDPISADINTMPLTADINTMPLTAEACING